MDLDILNKIDEDRIREKSQAAALKKKAERIADARKKFIAEPTPHISEALKMVYYCDTEERRMLEEILTKYFPDACREMELKLQGKSREHSDNSQRLSNQLKQYFSVIPES